MRINRKRVAWALFNAFIIDEKIPNPRTQDTSSNSLSKSSQSWWPTSTTLCPMYHDQSHPFYDAPRPIYRNVGLEKFDGKMDEWENWAHQFRVFTQLYNWTENKQLIHLISSLRGPVLTAHCRFSETECATVEACMHALDMRYGSKRPLTIASLRADLSVGR